jgi:lysophospholipase L1-like esterase
MNKSATLDVVIAMLGTNDAKKNNWLNLGNETQYKHDTAKMIDALLALPSKPKVYIATPPPLYHATYTMNQSAVGVIIPQILKEIATMKGVGFIDMITPLGGWPALSRPDFFLPNSTNGGCDTPGKCKGDGCHPDDAGHNAIARVVAGVIVTKPPCLVYFSRVLV